MSLRLLYRRLIAEPADRRLLVFSRRLISVAYFQMGFVQVISGFFSYVMVLAKNGFHPRQLIGIRKQWEDEENNDLQDGFGQEWVSSNG